MIALTMMIIPNELLFNHLGNPGFRHFCGVTLLYFNILSMQTIARDIFELHLHEKNKLIKFFKQKCLWFCFTIDTWKSIQIINNMVVTARYMDDDWRTQKRFLSFL